MRGLELARLYYEQIGRPVLEDRFPELLPQMAMGLAGEGSECFGFDDELSRDHDWGPGFCIWLDQRDYAEFGQEIQKAYDSLPGEWADFPPRSTTPEGQGRVGVLCIQDWYKRYTSFPSGPHTLAEWRRVPEAFLATAVNGEVFSDPLGRFSSVRRHLLSYYPEDIRLKKLANRAALMAQAGQYNYLRCAKRGETVAARLALADFARAAMSMGYLLNRQYAPFYKWMHQGLRSLPKLPRLYDQIGQLFQTERPAEVEEGIEGICINAVAELRRQDLSYSLDSFLLAHSGELLSRIRDPELRKTHIMED